MTNQPTLYSFPTSDILSTSLATTILAAQDSAVRRHNSFRIGISGGSLPAFLSHPSLTQSPNLKLGQWEVFFADERAVPLDHPDSNYALFKEKFLDLIPETGEKPKVHHIAVEHLDDTQELADEYEQALVRVFAAKDSVKLPIFDLLLLGCGPDGHTCSLFPGHELLRENVAWVAPIEDSPKPPPRRITLTLPVVTHALKICFVAVGEGKQEVLKQIFERPDEGLPCSLVNESAGERVFWFCDEKATGGVAFPTKSSL